MTQIRHAFAMHNSSPSLVTTALLLSLTACGSGDEDGSAGSGAGSGSGENLLGPQLDGIVLYMDANASGSVDGGDQLQLCFDQAVLLEGASASDFELLVPGDSFGSNASVGPGAGTDQVTLTLGAGASLRVQGGFAPGSKSSGASSGITLSAGGSLGSVRGVTSGRPAVAGAPLDLAPGFFSSGFTFGAWSVQGVDASDLNGDGILDLAVANGGSEPNRVLLGNGDGSFTETGQALGSSDSMDVVSGDLDQDGDLDLVVANHGNGQDQSSVWLNDGAGSFQMFASFGEGRANAMAIGDLDLDGDLDLVEGRGNGRGNQAWRNDGSANFTLWGDPMANNQTHTVLLSDLDRDGDLDLLEGNSGPNRVWFWDRAAQVFVDSGQRIGSGSTRTIAVADMDCDGDLDLIVAGRDPAWAWWNDGDGVFESGQRLANAATDCVAVEDLDGDRRPDIVAGNANRQANEVWYLDTAFNLDDSGLRLGDASTTDVALGDFDRDGDLDFVAGNDGELSMVWLNSLGNSGGNLSFTAGPDVGDGETAALIAADLDRDGALDLVEGEESSGQAARIWFGLGDGGFDTSPTELGVFATTSLATGDLSRDGRLGILQAQDSTSMPSGATLVWTEGGAVRTYVSTGLMAERSLAMAFGDADGDGDLDLFRGNEGAPQSGLWRNDGSGSLVKDATGPFGDGTVSAANFTDLDGDGDLDCLVAYEADGVRLYGNQDGDYTLSTHLLPGIDVSSMALGDLDRDGVPDLGLGLGVGVQLHLGDGTGSFGQPLAVLGAHSVTALAIADLNADGTLDLIAGHSSEDAQIWMNDGSAGFHAGLSLASGDCTAVLPLDLDCDGRIDLVFADRTIGGVNRIWLQD
ncbi:MAG: FG-GAP repeat domain-containing protein [Planctomycetota bacterium]|jgi:hypothetical protein